MENKQENNIQEQPKQEKKRRYFHFGQIVRLSTFVYAVICNIPVTFALCLTSSIYGVSSITDGVLSINFAAIDWASLMLNWGVAEVLAVIVGCFVPLVTIGRWFTHLFHVDNVTYKGNMPFRLLACLAITIVYFLAITPTLTVFNWLVYRATTFPVALLNMVKCAPFILIVGYTVSLITDIWVYQIAHAMDEEF